MGKAKILVVDDEKLLRWTLEQNLSKDGYEIVTAENGVGGLKAYRDDPPDLILLDINLPDLSGVEVLEGIKEMDQDALVVMITAFGDIKTAVRTIKLGAYDFLEKPFNMDKLRLLIEKALETVCLRREVSKFREQLSGKYGFNSIIGESALMKDVFNLLRKIAQSDATTVLIQGESGTGKDVTARVIHYQSQRAAKPFMEINCTALPDNLIESELFGHERGSFTDAKATKKGLFELADEGTIFLDEIGDMTLSTQAKLLKVIEGKTFKRIGGVHDITVNVRVVAATNKNLSEAVRTGAFREDLYYRLKIIPVVLPPLREREEDAVILAKYFIDEFNREFHRETRGLSPEAAEAFLRYSWPGNVRELKNVIERTMILENVETILPENLPQEIVSHQHRTLPGRNRENKMNIAVPPEGVDIEEVERELIRQALEMTNGNQTRAAKLLRLTRDALRYRMQKFGFLDAPHSRTSRAAGT